jgi:predicted helicase
MDYFKGSEGGRVVPLLHPGGKPNLAKGLLDALSTLVASDLFEGNVTADDVLAYVAAVTSHPAFTETFADELTTPGVRVPMTADPSLWAEAVELGRRVLWLHTYGNRFADPEMGRAAANIRYPNGDVRRILNHTAVKEMPDEMTYDSDAQVVHLGGGSWGPVSQAMFDYKFGGKNVLRSWMNYRKLEPGGRKSSPLDAMNVTTWPSDWSRDLTDLLSLLAQIVDLEPSQADLLARIVEGAVLTRNALQDSHGVIWPTGPQDRKPDYTAIEVVEHDRDADTRLF